MSTPPTSSEPLPPDSWPGAGGRRSIAPQMTRTTPSLASHTADTVPPRGERVLREPANRVSPKAKRMWMLGAGFAELFPLAAVVAWMVLDDGRRLFQWPVLGVLLLLAVLHVGVSPLWRYRVHRWEVTDEAVYTQVGWISQERRIAPISRIQTVDAQFGPLQRMFGLGTLVVTTASAAGPLHIAGLERPIVERLVADLTRITAASADDAT